MTIRATTAVKRLFLLASSVLLVLVIGFLDYITGYRASFSIFYLLPVFLATWYAGLAAGAAMSGLSTVAWLFADVFAGHMGFAEPVLYWNATVRLGFYLVVTTLGSSLKGALDRAVLLSRIDPLTGAANVRVFYELSSVEIERARRHHRPLSAAFVDLDNFKSVNDRSGHQAGDCLLRLVAQAMKESVRSTDVVARLGGDEFMLLLPETSAAEASKAANRLRERLLTVIGEQGCPVTLSVGVATFETPPASVDDLVRRTDALMYSVKNGGKNGCRCEVLGDPVDSFAPEGLLCSGWGSIRHPTG